MDLSIITIFDYNLMTPPKLQADLGLTPQAICS